jgi:hypothetical protein
MLRIILHAIVLPAMLWLDRRHGWKLAPWRAAGIWFLLGVPLMAVEASASAGSDRVAVFLQSVFVAVFFLPPAYFAFRHARKDASVGAAFALYVLLSLVAAFVAALALARAPVVRGFLGAG